MFDLLCFYRFSLFFMDFGFGLNPSNFLITLLRWSQCELSWNDRKRCFLSFIIILYLAFKLEFSLSLHGINLDFIGFVALVASLSSWSKLRGIWVGFYEIRLILGLLFKILVVLNIQFLQVQGLVLILFLTLWYDAYWVLKVGSGCSSH